MISARRCRQADSEPPWNNASANFVPAEWTGTLSGLTPAFLDAGGHDYRPAPGSPLLAAGNGAPTSPLACPFPAPTALPQFLPPIRAWQAPGTAAPRALQSPPTIGAVIEASDTISANDSE